MTNLPYDLLFLIFSECVAFDAEAAAHLSGVCQQWRENVIGSPRLWRHINLHLPSSVTRETLQGLHNKAILWTTNSQTELVDITIDYGARIDLLLHLLSYATPSAHRWNKITFIGKGSVLIRDGGHFQYAATLTIPSIRQRFSSIAEASWTRRTTLDSTQFIIPHIKLRLEFSPSSELPKNIPLGPLGLFTSLRIESEAIGEDWVEVLDVLSHFTSLQRLKFFKCDSLSKFPCTPNPLQISSLYELHLCGFYGRNNFPVWLIMPNLKSLTVESAEVQHGFHDGLLVGPSLTSLYLRNVSIHKQEFEEMVEAFVELETLEFGALNVEGAMLDAIGPDPDGPRNDRAIAEYPLPRLASLILGRVAGVFPNDLVTMAMNHERASELSLALPLKLWSRGCH